MSRRKRQRRWYPPQPVPLELPRRVAGTPTLSEMDRNRLPALVPDERLRPEFTQRASDMTGRIIPTVWRGKLGNDPCGNTVAEPPTSLIPEAKPI